MRSIMTQCDRKLPFSPGRRRFEDAKKVLTEKLSSIIAEKKSKMDPNHVDLLSRLLQTTSENPEDVLTDTELLDEMMVLCRVV